jgi:hypothetical protein
MNMLRTLLLLLGWAPCLLSAQSSGSNGPFRYAPPAPETSAPELAFEDEIQSLLIERWSQRGIPAATAQPAASLEDAWDAEPGGDAWETELEAASQTRDSLMQALRYQARLWNEAHAMQEALDPRALRKGNAPQAEDLRNIENQSLAALERLTAAVGAQDQRIVAIASRYAEDASPGLR